MLIRKQRVTCQGCQTVQDVEIVTDAPFSVVIASMKAAHCAKCGGTTLELGGSYEDVPPVTAPLEIRADWWLNRGDVGISSETIYSVFAGTHIARADVPHDPQDFNRCKLLLDLFPEWRPDLDKVAERYLWFRPFSDKWPRFEQLLAEEWPTGTAPKLYHEMQLAYVESLRMRYPKARIETGEDGHLRSMRTDNPKGEA